MRFSRFIKNDYPSLFSISITIVGIIAIIVSNNSRGFDMKFTIGVSILSLATLIIFIRRFLYLKKLFSNGETVTATVTDTTFLRKNGTITFSYKYAGTEYTAKNSVTTNRQTRSIKKENTIEVLVDPTNSAKAYIKELFI